MIGTAVYKSKPSKDDRFCIITKAVSATAEDLELPKYLDGRYVTEIGGGAFKKCPRLKTVTIPDTVTAIAPKAFAGSRIESIVIPETVTAIGSRAFDRCIFLREVTVLNPNAVLGRSLFSGCYCIKRAVLPVSAFADRWFTSVEYLTVTGNGPIPEKLFKDCAVKSLTVGEGIDEIGDSAFCDCSELSEVVLPDSLKIIECCAFENCTALKSFTIPKGVDEIGYNAFSGCIIESFRVDENNSKFRSDGNCIIDTDEKTLVVGCTFGVIPSDGSVDTIGDDAFSGCAALTAVEIPSGIKRIGDSAFSCCDNLESIVLSEGLEVIEDFAFAGCSELESVNIPSTVKKLGFGIFDDCESLSDVFYNGTLRQWNGIEKDGDIACISSFMLHCSDGVTDEYKV